MSVNSLVSSAIHTVLSVSSLPRSGFSRQRREYSLVEDILKFDGDESSVVRGGFVQGGMNWRGSFVGAP